MCLSPILIKNKSRMYRGKVDTLTAFHDTSSQYIYVPCGVCAECVKKKQMYLVQRVQLESLDNYIFFATFTYKNDVIRSVDVNGYTHYYADRTDFQNMMKRVRKSVFFSRFTSNGKCSIKYLYVTEYGGKRHRPHFHAMFFVPKSASDNVFTPVNYASELYALFKSEWRRNVGSRRSPLYVPLCEFITRGNKRTYDLHYVNPLLSSSGASDVGFYVTKYCLKFDSWIDDKRKALYLNLDASEYASVWNLLRPRVEYSNYFGLSSSASSYIRDCIDKYSSRSLYPLFRNPVDGKLFPMSPYLFNKYGTLEDKYTFYYRSLHPDCYEDSFHYTDVDYLHYTAKNDKFASQCGKIVDTDVYDYIK